MYTKIRPVIEILKNPAVYAAFSGLMSAIGWEIRDSALIDHLLGGLGALAGIIGIIIAARKSEPES